MIRRPALLVMLVLFGIGAMAPSALAVPSEQSRTAALIPATEADVATFTAGKGVFDYYWNYASVPVKIKPRHLGQNWRVTFTVKGEVVGQTGGCFEDYEGDSFSYSGCSVPTKPLNVTMSSSETLGAGTFKATAAFEYTMYDNTVVGKDVLTAKYTVVRAKTRTTVGVSSKKVSANEVFTVAACVSAGDDPSPYYWKSTYLMYKFNKGGSDDEISFSTDRDGCFSVTAALGKSTKATFYAVTYGDSKFVGSKSKKIIVARR